MTESELLARVMLSEWARQAKSLLVFMKEELAKRGLQANPETEKELEYLISLDKCEPSNS